MACGKKLHGRQGITVEGMIVGPYRLHQADAEMDVAAFERVQQARTHRFDQLDLHIRPAFGVSMQELRKHAFHRLWCGRNLQDAGVGSPQSLSALAERADCAKDGAAIAEQLLALAGQNQTAPNAVEQPEPELFLELLDLAGECGLGDAQPQRRLRDSALLGNGDEGSQVPKVHGWRVYARSA